MFDSRSPCWQCNHFAAEALIFMDFSFSVVSVQLDPRKRGTFPAGISATRKWVPAVNDKITQRFPGVQVVTLFNLLFKTYELLSLGD